MLTDLATNRALATEFDLDDFPEVLGKMEQLRETLWARLALRIDRVRSKSLLGDSVSILLPNAILQSAAELSLQSGDPSSCQLFQHPRYGCLVCFF
jgi:hypothetical protein